MPEPKLAAPQLRFPCYTERNKSVLLLLCCLALLLSPLIAIIHGTYFVHRVQFGQFFPHEFGYEGLIWDILKSCLFLWWFVKPLQLKRYSQLTWQQIFAATPGLFLTFVFFAYPFTTGVPGSLLRGLWMFLLPLLTLSSSVSNFLGLLLTAVTGITLCELISLGCSQMIRREDSTYWILQGVIFNTVMIALAYIVVLGQQGRLGLG